MKAILTVSEVAYVLSRCMGITDATVTMTGRIVKDEVAAAVMKFCSWNASDHITTIETETLKEQVWKDVPILCILCIITREVLYDLLFLKKHTTMYLNNY